VQDRQAAHRQQAVSAQTAQKVHRRQANLWADGGARAGDGAQARGAMVQGRAAWARDEGAREARRVRGGGLTRVHQQVAVPPENLSLSLSEPDTLEA